MTAAEYSEIEILLAAERAASAILPFSLNDVYVIGFGITPGKGNLWNSKEGAASPSRISTILRRNGYIITRRAGAKARKYAPALRGSQ